MTGAQTLVSVVIPTMNGAEFLSQTIESVLQQDYPDIECWVVDGASSDETISILQGYGERIKWVSEPDEGHADAINKGWEMCQGEILAWLNPDDVWEVPSAITQVVNYFREHPEVDVVYGDCGSIDEQGNVIGMSYCHDWDLEYAVEYADHCIPQPAAFIRRAIVDRVGALDTTIFNKDREFWLRIGLVGTIRHIPVLLAHARNSRGISFDGSRVAPSIVSISRKFFSSPGVPTALRKKERRSMSNAYLRGAAYAWEGGRLWQIVTAYIGRAILTDPTNTKSALASFLSFARASIRHDSESRAMRLTRATLKSILHILRGGRLAVAEIKAAVRSGPVRPNLLGDRDIEWAWVAAKLPESGGEALDFGNGGSNLGLIAAEKGFNVTALDLGSVEWPYRHPHLHAVRGDVLTMPFPSAHFDLVINCSTVEHVGLVGRYGVTEEDLDGDLRAMQRLLSLMKPGGTMILTIPLGQDAVFAPLCRVYGPARLPRLLHGYRLQEELYWVKDTLNRWLPAARSEALAFEASASSWDATENVYALGCFVLRRPEGEE